MKPFIFVIERETNEFVEAIDFTASLETVIFGRYDNESPPLLEYFFKHNYVFKK